MGYRKIAAFPFAWVGLFLIVLLCVPAAGRAPFFVAESETSKALAAGGCLVAAYAFERGDYMRRAWTFNALCYLLLLCRDVLMNFVAPGTLVGGAVHIEAVDGTLALVANASAVWGTWLLARAWSFAGLEPPGSRRTRAALVILAAVFAVGVSGTDLFVDVQTLVRGDLGSLHGVGSDVGDIFGLCLLAPLILTAAAMSGGVLKWPWGLLTASILFWLCYDATATLAHLLPGHDVGARLTKETFRALACACECAAGLAQRRVVTAPEEEGAADAGHAASKSAASARASTMLSSIEQYVHPP